MNNTFKKLFFTVAISVCLFTFCLPIYATPQASRHIIKVGYTDYRAFISMDSTGEYSGYGVDYLNEIAKYTDFEYEFVYGTWQDILEKLVRKEIDLVCTANYSKERGDIFEFSVFPIGIGQELLYTSPEKINLYYDDFVGLHMSTIGFLEGSNNSIAFDDYAKRNSFSFIEKLFSTDSEMENALLSGEIDAIATEHMSLHDNLRLIGKYGSNPFYCMSYKNNSFMAELNWAISEIKSRDATFDAKLYTRHYGNSKAEITPAFTREEFGYIKKNALISVGILPTRHPLSAYDNDSGNLYGITVDMVREIEKISGLRFDLQPIPVDEKPISFLKNKKFDTIAGIVRGSSFLSDPQLRLSSPFLTTKLAVGTLSGVGYDPSQPYTVAVKSSFQVLHEYLEEYYPHYKLLFRATDEECIQAILDGQADIMLQNSYTLNYWIQKPIYNRLQIVPAYFLEEKTGFATLASQNPLVISIINKSIACISDDTANQFVIANTLGNPYKLTTGDFIYKYKSPLAVLLFMLFISVGLFVSLLAVKLRNLRQMNIKNSELVSAISRAEQASLAKSQFLAHMSHEIRTPINAIVGLTTITKQHTDNPKKVFENLNRISESSKLLLTLVNAVLDMSAIENEMLKIDSSPFDFKQLINSVTLMYYGQCRQNGIDFIARVNDLTDEVLVGDSLRVNQILLNLLSNALKFTEPGGIITLTISQTQHNKAQTFLHFDITDTGCGMTQEMAHNIFAPFVQESTATAKIYGGSGLGMSITKNFVDLMHGAITVKSKKGVGTTFSVELPFGIPEHRQLYTGKDFSQLRTLVVDDDKDTCDYTSAVLDRLGIPHESAVSGLEALEKIKKSHHNGERYDLCFIDWIMPEMDGLTLVQNIRAEFGDSSIIIIVSAFDLTEIEEIATEAGANMLVTKPLFQSTLFNLLMSLGSDSTSCSEAVDTRYNFEGHHLLLVEDNSLNMEIALELLNTTGIKSHGVSNGKLALDAFQNSPAGTYDIILMDIQMPVMDGHESSAAIRASNHPDAKTIPIYAITANAFTEDIALALSCGMNGHISKPIDTDIMFSVIKKEIEHKGKA